MFLISVEGGDGSGKGLAAKIISDFLEHEYSFTSVESTWEPRRQHPLGRLAIDSVRKKSLSPEREAGLFAADRLDHSHGWILPKLRQGRAIVSERNIHSSLVYQGIVGGIGVEKVAHLNSAALIPDLCIWVDCNPEIAMRRISTETLRGLSNKSEYFETTKFQSKIRDGYRSIFSGKFDLPTPFDMGAIVGPIINEGTQKEFENAIIQVVRNFMKTKPKPINVDTEEVEIFLINNMIKKTRGQSILTEFGISNKSLDNNWLENKFPWQILKYQQNKHLKIISDLDENIKQNIPQNLLEHSLSSIIGTLSLVHSHNISELRMAMGPVRYFSHSHTHNLIRFLNIQSNWISKLSKNKSKKGREVSRYQLKDEKIALGKLLLAIWPIRKYLKRWQISNPKTHIRYSLGQLIKSGECDAALHNTIRRLNILGSGMNDTPPPKTKKGLLNWWLGK